MCDDRFRLSREYLRTITDLNALTATSEGIDVSSDDGRGELVEAAKRCLADDVATDPDQQFAIEAIIIPGLRPVIDVRDGAFSTSVTSWADLSADQATKDRICRALPLVGRVEVPGHPTMPYGGTGFMVGPGVVMTNRHVAETFASGLGRRGLSFRPGLGSAIDFRREDLGDPSEAVPVDRVLMVHPYWDMALLEVDGLRKRAHPSVPRLSVRPPEELAGRRVAVIGYPAFDRRNDPRVQLEVFRSRFDVKRIQPGFVSGTREVHSFGRRVRALTHDASTLGGNSGSAVVDVDTGTILALHFAGVYLDANFAVPAAELARDARVVGAGVLFEADVRGEPAATGAWWGAVETLDDGSARTALPADAALFAGAPAPIAGAEVTLTIPLEITVRVGSPRHSRSGSHADDPPT